MSAKELQEALDGPKGSLDGYLEARSDAEIKADIRALTAPDRREHFAAMAMQGILSCADRTTFGVEVNGVKLQRSDAYATVAVKFADALIAELAKAKP